MSSAVPPPVPGPAPRLRPWRYVGRLAPLAVLWCALVGWLGWLLFTKANWAHESDEADVREWLNETRVFRKPLPELVREYVDLADGADTERLRLKHDEIATHLASLAEPARMYSGKLPLFPEVYSLAIEYPNQPAPPGRSAHPKWTSPVPRPGVDVDGRVRVLRYRPGPGTAFIRCEYRVHTNHRFEQEQRERRSWQIPLVVFLIPATGLAGYYAFRFLRRERDREVKEWESRVATEHRERELAEAQRAAETLKSELYASIGIMAGSYAHNIKNLLVRPNDLLARCLDADGLSGDQDRMLREVRTTLGTVTERLQQILRTVRRDPSKAELTRVDLAALLRETHRTWAEMAWDKWKLRLTVDAPADPLAVTGDLSHLQQAVENLLFNARDATFEMRNHLREEARRAADPDARRARLLEAAAWKGEIAIRVRRDSAGVILDVQDNGIGMTGAVRENCRRAHFTTKRDNALYEGYSAGMGLGLSFVAVVLEHHRATMEIESAHLAGALFRVRFPGAERGLIPTEGPS